MCARQGPVSERKRLTASQPGQTEEDRHRSLRTDRRVPQPPCLPLHKHIRPPWTAKTPQDNQKKQTQRMLRFKETIEKLWFGRRREILFLSISLLGHFIVSEKVT